MLSPSKSPPSAGSCLFVFLITFILQHFSLDNLKGRNISLPEGGFLETPQSDSQPQNHRRTEVALTPGGSGSGVWGEI